MNCAYEHLIIQQIYNNANCDIIMQGVRRILLLIALSLMVVLPAQCDQGDDDDIIDIDKIPVFPNYDHNISAGYLNITTFNQAFYYIFAVSQDNPKDDPLILWLNGGPGCSSLTGFFSQNGPFYFKEEDPSHMQINPYSWNNHANVLYLESPGGVGFSTASDKYLTTNDTSVAKDNLKALQIFFDRYPTYKGNDFYLAGESYAGIYIPRLAVQILDFNEGQQERRIKLRGILLGNACTDPRECSTNKYMSRYTVKYLYSRGFIEEDQYFKYVNKCTQNEGSTDCVAYQKTLSDNFVSSGASIYNIYGKCYKPLSSQYQQILALYEQKAKKYHQLEHSLKHPLRCTDAIGPLTLLNRNEFRIPLKAMVSNTTLPWTPCSDKLNYTIQKQGSNYTLPTLVNAGLKIFYFTGDLDAIVPIVGTLSWFEEYSKDKVHGMPVKKNWRPWVTNNQNISGMVWQLEGMTLATVRGAGHLVPSDKPQEAEEILNVFLGRNNWKYPDYYPQSEVQ